MLLSRSKYILRVFLTLFLCVGVLCATLRVAPFGSVIQPTPQKPTAASLKSQDDTSKEIPLADGTFEKNEENKDDKNKDDNRIEGFFLHSKAFQLFFANYSVFLGPCTYDYVTSRSCPPLYVLFHAWKHFFIKSNV